MSAYSAETQQGSPFDGDSLAASYVNFSWTASPNLEDDDNVMSTGTGGHSPLSLYPAMSPSLLIADGDSHMSPAQAQHLMESLQKSVWSGRIHVAWTQCMQIDSYLITDMLDGEDEEGV